MKPLGGWRDQRTGRVFGFQSEAQRENFMAARARFSDGPNRQMPRCTATNRLGEPCKAARMRGRSTCFRHSGAAAAKRARLAAAHLSGDVDRIQRAEMRSERNRLGALWRRDPREPGRTIVLIANDEATCRGWAVTTRFPNRYSRPRVSGVLRCVPVDLGPHVARSDRRRRGDHQAYAAAQSDHGGEPCIRSFEMSMVGWFRWCSRNAGSRHR